jgi:putative transposase
MYHPLMMLGYKSNNNVVYSSKYHVIWCPKYRRKVIVGDIAKRLEEIIRKTALKYRADVIALEIMPDHVHMLCEVDPQFGIHRFVKNIKGAPAKSLDEFVLRLNRWRCTARSH